MAKVGSVGCVGFLVEGTSACVLVDEAGSCLSGGQVHVWWCVILERDLTSWWEIGRASCRERV